MKPQIHDKISGDKLLSIDALSLGMQLLLKQFAPPDISAHRQNPDYVHVYTSGMLSIVGEWESAYEACTALRYLQCRIHTYIY